MSRRTRTNRSRPIHPSVTDWVVKVNAAGDGVPASALVANREFVKRCYVGGFWQSKMRNGVVLTFATNTLNGVVTPLASPSGITITNVAFASSDYSLSTGLGSNPNSGKRLTSNYSPSTYLPQSSGQLSAYCRTNRQETGYPAAIAAEPSNGGDPRILLHIYTDPNTYWDCWDAGGTGRTTRSFSSSLGLVTGSRISTTDSRVYQNGVQVGATNTSTVTTSPPIDNVSFFRGNNAAIPFETRTFSYFYVGDGLTSSEESQHYTAVQQMQMRLNRAV